MTLDELRNKRHGAHSQMVYWARRVAELDKQIRLQEKRDAVSATDGLQRERKGVLAPRPAGGERLHDDGQAGPGDVAGP